MKVHLVTALNFVISLFACPPALDARGRRPVRPLFCTPLSAGDLLGPCGRPSARGHHVDDPCCGATVLCTRKLVIYSFLCGNT